MTTIPVLVSTVAEEIKGRSLFAEIMAEVLSTPPCSAADMATVNSVDADVMTRADILAGLLEPAELSDMTARLNNAPRNPVRIYRGNMHRCVMSIYLHDDGALHVEGPAHMIAAFDVCDG